jgi:photosystem II stability/assembly factor-like uncharacterized protein
MKVVILALGIALSAGACKRGSGGGGGGGGGGGWLVGRDGLMVNVTSAGDASGYDLATKETLNVIACRYFAEAWVVGTKGTLLYTNDGGQSWQPQTVPTSADLRALATQNWGPVFIGGDGVFLTSTDTGATWKAVGDGTVSFRSIAAAQDAETVLAVSEDGALWSYDDGQLVQRQTISGARTVAVSRDGQIAVVVGDNLITKSTDAGRTWSPLVLSENVRFDDVRIDGDGKATAVGSGGALAHISVEDKVTLMRVGDADLHTIQLTYDNDEDLGFTAGEGGQVWITNDAGWTWSAGPNVGGTALSMDQIGSFHR